MALDRNGKVVGLDYMSLINKVCNNKRTKPYVSKPLSEAEIRKVYRNDFFPIDSNAYFDYPNKDSRGVANTYR